MCAHILSHVLGWNVVSVGTKAVLREIARPKKRCCSSFKTMEFSSTHRVVPFANGIQVLQCIFFFPRLILRKHSEDIHLQQQDSKVLELYLDMSGIKHLKFTILSLFLHLYLYIRNVSIKIIKANLLPQNSF